MKHRLASSPNHMHMRRPLIIEIDGHPQAAKSRDRWHSSFYDNPKRLGYETSDARSFHIVILRPAHLPHADRRISPVLSVCSAFPL
jgi:hypothetical protein